ncbi:MAG: response regulator [Phycisphaeraceae bacterium]|nr:response regulator [Phycisphaeraceae bacterium]
MRILVADQSRTMRNIARAVLAQLGYYDVDEASNGQEAIARACLANFDLCLFDHAMIGNDAKSLVDSLRQAGATTKCILLRNSDSPAFEPELPGVQILNKPFAPEALRRCIEGAIAAATRLRAA